jgi:molybdopterin converting factor small subunit
MDIQVSLGDPLWKSVGQRQIGLELSGDASVADALAVLRSSYPEFGAALEAGATRVGIPFNCFVNRRLVKDGDLGQHKLKEGDTLYILAPIVGGQNYLLSGQWPRDESLFA